MIPWPLLKQGLRNHTNREVSGVDSLGGSRKGRGSENQEAIAIGSSNGKKNVTQGLTTKGTGSRNKSNIQNTKTTGSANGSGTNGQAKKPSNSNTTNLKAHLNQYKADAKASEAEAGRSWRIKCLELLVQLRRPDFSDGQVEKCFEALVKKQHIGKGKYKEEEHKDKENEDKDEEDEDKDESNIESERAKNESNISSDTQSSSHPIVTSHEGDRKEHKTQPRTVSVISNGSASKSLTDEGNHVTAEDRQDRQIVPSSGSPPKINPNDPPVRDEGSQDPRVSYRPSNGELDSDTNLLSWTESNDSTTATVLVPLAVSATTSSSPDLSSSTNDERDHDTNTPVSSESSHRESESLSIAASTFSTDIPPEDLSGRIEAPPQRYNGRGVDLIAPGQKISVNGKDFSVINIRTKEEKVTENEINRPSTKIITFSEVEHRQCVEQLRIELGNMRQHNARPFDQDTENIYNLIDHALNHLARKDGKTPFTLSKRLLECYLVQLRDLKDYEKNTTLSDRSSQIHDILLGLFGAIENKEDLQSYQVIYGQY